MVLVVRVVPAISGFGKQQSRYRHRWSMRVEQSENPRYKTSVMRCALRLGCLPQLWDGEARVCLAVVFDQRMYVYGMSGEHLKARISLLSYSNVY